MVVALAALGSGPAFAGNKIVMIEKVEGLAYYAAAEAGAKEAAKELGDEVIFNSPANGKVPEQSRIIQSAIAQHVNGIILSALDPNAIAPDMKDANAAGVKAITYDADVQPAARPLFAMQATDEGIGRSLTQVICEVVPNCEGEIAFMSSVPNSPNLSKWVHWAQEELKLPKYAKLKVVDLAYGGEQDSGAYTKAQELLNAHPKLAGLIVPGSVQVAAAARAIKDAKLTGKVQVTGLGVPSELKAYVADGTIKKFVLWNPTDLGYLATYMDHYLIDGSLTNKEGASFKAGRLGEFKVIADGVVLLGPPLQIDKNNIESLKF
jgi:rhamnose transport system substrate-binding protein